MTKVSVPDKCDGIDMPDGTRYNSRNGVVDIAESHHVAALRTSVQRKNDWIGKIGSHYAFGAADENTCVCGFVAFAWQEKCPRCGTQLRKEEADARTT